MEQQLNLLKRALKQELFRFVLIQYNHFSIVDRVRQFLHDTFPERPVKSIEVEKLDYQSLIGEITGFGKGILVIEDFEKLLKREDLYIGFNQRRDMLTQYPIAILAFVPDHDSYLKEISQKLPDLWSFRSLQLEMKSKPDRLDDLELLGDVSSIGGFTVEEKLAEAERLTTRIRKLTGTKGNISQLQPLYVQLFGIYEDLGAYKKGLETVNRILSDSEGLDILNHQDFLSWKGIFLSYLGRYQEAEKLLKRVLELNLKNLGSKHPSVARSQSDLANVYSFLGKYEKAADLLEQALDSAIKNFGPKHPTVAARQSNLANIYSDLGRYELATSLLEQALDSAIKNFGPEHPTVVGYQSNLANLYRDLGRYDQAAKLLEQALDSAIKNFGPKHPTVAGYQSNLANVYRDLGRYDQAANLLEQALDSDFQNFGADHPNVAISQSNLANVYSSLGKYEKATELLEQSLDSAIKNFGPDHPTVAARQNNLAFVYIGLGDWNRAKYLLEKAYLIYLNSLGEKHPNTINTLEGLVSVEEKLKMRRKT